MNETLSMYDIIVKKRDGFELTRTEMNYWIKGCVAQTIPDYQSSALLMALFLKGMSEAETNYLTEAMVNSGDILDLSSIPGIKVDKHSSGGVGDKTSLVVAPLACAGGLKVAKMSGRGLGHTGGTLDKLESISGFRVDQSEESFINQVRDFGIAIIGQTKQLVPADQKLYALRDVTATVNSIPLIAASIMSKKLATGADVIVLDVKYGSGAFVKTPEDAGRLAAAMIKIGSHYDRKVSALITNMEQPLGFAVGNGLEVEEAIATLNGGGPADLIELSTALAGELIYQSQVKNNRQDALVYANKLLSNKKAWKQFLNLVNAQGGSLEQVKSGKLAKATYKIKIEAMADGYVKSVEALAIGNAVRRLGAGRQKQDDIINPNVGVVLAKKVGDSVKLGDCLAIVYADEIVRATEIATEVLGIFAISPQPVQPISLIFGIVDANGFTPWSEIK